MKSSTGEIISNSRVGEDLYKLEFFSPSVCRSAEPGQFLNIRCSGPDQLDPLLRRPFSIYDTDENFNVATILYLVRGKGTRFLSRLARGDILDFCGPLGNPVQPAGDKVLLVAGGIGIAPLLFLAKVCIQQKKEVYMLAGFKDQRYMLVEKDMMRLNLNYMIYCEQDRWANRGLVTDGISNMSKYSGYEIYCCGPLEMLKSLQAKLAGASNKIVALLEERMACGVGVCDGCAVKVREGRDGFGYLKVCSDGPAFNLMEVVFE
ncbi:MAG: dihydroorotate dehydrogenase electron transfer subunit [Actinomycetota bacterium]